MIDFHIIALGAIVGFIVGGTGIAGASLLTPILISMGYPIQMVIGTDLLYNTVNKSFSSIIHWQKKNIDFLKIKIMLKGSIPGIITAGIALNFINIYSYEHAIKATIGVMVIITILLNYPSFLGIKPHSTLPNNLVIFISFLLGAIVCLTSIGSGILFTTLLLYTNTSMSKIVGTDILHAVIITFVSSLFHVHNGQYDLFILLNLLLGSIPDTYFSSSLSNKIPSTILYYIITVLMLVLSIKLLKG